MTKHNKRISLAFMSLILAITCAFVNCMTNYWQTKASIGAITRNIEVTQNEIDYQSVFDEFEDAKLETQGTFTTFEGIKPITFEDFSELNNLSESDIVICEKIYVTYNFSYDAETNIVTLAATTKSGENIIEIEEIEGIAFHNEYGNVDALLDIDGDCVLLSEIQDTEMIQNCGWFKNLWKKIVVATVAVVAVAAVATVVVATCGAGLGACIVAGAVAGAITGGVAGGLISYSEYGKLDWRWVVGGVVIGGALGAVTGWGVGSFATKTLTAQTNNLINAAKNGKLKFSDTVNNYYISGQRPYSNSTQLVQEIMKAKNPIKDPQTATGLKWQVEGVLQCDITNGKLVKGVWELVVDSKTHTVWHFLFRT